MSLIAELFGKSPFGPLVQHAKKVRECVMLIKPLMEACVREDWDEIHRLQDMVTRIEYEADVIKHEIREHLPRRYFLPVARPEIEKFLRSQDKIADEAQDFAVILVIRKTRIHPALAPEFFALVEQVLAVTETLISAAEELETLAESSFQGAEAEAILAKISGLAEGEWLTDRMQRKTSQHMYTLEGELDPVTISFYEKMLQTLSKIANAAENTGDQLRMMITKG
ncbi:MAG TPA: TIGR00153 family protein [Candidatus Brocadiia bacterium]|nr:TIGR00153 family protein [Candidatus Brocadiia bacterium]